MQELRSLVEKCGIVLVAFKDEVFALANLETAPEIFGNPTDEKRRPGACDFEYLGEHGSGSRLAMGPGNHQHLFSNQELIV